ncbi:hypothetical protein LCGC14_2067620 [marine sediment metagenome]|uniref:Uncharacterized protein n=1 Tax=marine sediment metagenome TaxID=412755 RepID=A0A0F9EJ91_9ZZZZ
MRRAAPSGWIAAALACAMLALDGCGGKKTPPVVHKGKTVGQWVHQLMAGDGGLRFEAITACGEMGPSVRRF